ncbi:MAG: tyrosine--tRNA ligase [Desulfobacterales bacterium]|nr:tyrosine--tRNA ligase [Desulfobacterales bacterium]
MKETEEQINVIMQGAEFGDPQTKETMTRELRERLKEGRPLRIYCGYDATKPDLHLGHTVTMRKLKQFQDFGHEVTFLIGDFTTRVGDPSDKDKLRPQLGLDIIEENARTYAEQAFKILDPERTKVRYNSEWLDKLTLADALRLASSFTTQQFLARDNFQKRVAKNDPIWLHEFFYALLQGYDAVALETDVQLGATEQLFNLLAGRKLQESFGQRPQICVTFPILLGTDGHMRMSKSTGNYIGITEPPEDMYGKVMSIPDIAMNNYFNLVTRWTPEEISLIEADMESGKVHPMDIKKKLAWEITDYYHGSEAADASAKHFERVHQKRKLPEDIPQFVVDKPVAIPDLLLAAGLSKSKSDGRRLVQQGGVKIDGKPVESIDFVVNPGEMVLQVGKRRFVQLVTQK